MLAPNKDIQRLERLYEEMEIQLKNIYVENSKEFESIKEQYQRTSDTSR